MHPILQDFRYWARSQSTHDIGLRIALGRSASQGLDRGAGADARDGRVAVSAVAFDATVMPAPPELDPMVALSEAGWRVA